MILKVIQNDIHPCAARGRRADVYGLDLIALGRRKNSVNTTTRPGVQCGPLCCCAAVIQSGYFLQVLGKKAARSENARVKDLRQDDKVASGHSLDDQTLYSTP